MSKFTLTVFTCLALASFAACGGSTGTDLKAGSEIVSPSEVTAPEVDEASKLALVFDEIQSVASKVFGALQAAFNCTLFDKFIHPMDKVFLCPGGGEFTFSVIETACEDDPGMFASVSLQLDFSECVLGKLPVNGISEIGIAMDETMIAASVSTDLTEVNQVPITATDVSVEVAYQGGAACTGTIVVWDLACEMKPDCKGCTILE